MDCILENSISMLLLTSKDTKAKRKAHTNSSVSFLEIAPVFGDKEHPEHIKQRQMKITVLRAVLRATAWITTAIRRLDLDASRGLMEHFFGPDKQSGAKGHFEPRKMLSKMLYAVHNLYVRWGRFCCAGNRRTACVTPGLARDSDNNKFILQVCPFFAEIDIHMRTQTIIHELTHFFGTLDHAYGQAASAELALQDASKARNNADNYKFFVRALIHRHLITSDMSLNSFESVEGRWEPHEQCSIGCGESVFEDHRLWGGGMLGLQYSTPSSACQRCEWKKSCSGNEVKRWLSVCSGLLCCEELQCQPALRELSGKSKWELGERESDHGLGETFFYHDLWLDWLEVPGFEKIRASSTPMTAVKIPDGANMRFTLARDVWTCTGKLAGTWHPGDAVLLDVNRCSDGRSAHQRVIDAFGQQASGIFLYGANGKLSQALKVWESLEKVVPVWLLKSKGGLEMASMLASRERVEVVLVAGRRGYKYPLRKANNAATGAT
eukprot:TRINITY_DN20463_c0_g1_i1.p1 TRINITY_DN20463_c0_g1~~TRINITY_DN20463_c0_g1_i1.p1  ORF type:complete len:494 (-),score=42.75 TRINITY_DN20463_c0_g1_i1:96-1577(-)